MRTDYDDSEHKQSQQMLKTLVNERVKRATISKGVMIVYTGNGKGKTTAAMGTAVRAIGYGKKVGVVQFIKGKWDNGEYNFLKAHNVDFFMMGTGFTWETQDREKDIAAANLVWEEARRMLVEPAYDLVIMDEITYMITYGYIPLNDIIAVLQNRPEHQSIILTGRDCHEQLMLLADTVTEMRAVKHGFDKGIKAQPGIDW
ncbi:cob(I)alamin adenosyltransferase [Serratia fonticola]|uniref:Corrinoid adenosyltransferase n=1 Tax=Serratia fonticola TaxID=47917 RepID=A0A542BLB8_SERFO|nr:cob(I)yrinic acid a,c-diamide adenosyltransferase [Serratia fonticola]TQI79361.1 cob(I)alamin adenosyltransferase [Serratia fonticola]TQI98614.1 cob(I)alamin adenosyltransferase [Serratia fonticola]TVZ68142.1 cob(I)alamin adenosyltransferase [Serratia fonticola]